MIEQRIVAMACVVGLVFGLAGCEPAAIAESTSENKPANAEAVALSTEIEQASYAIGYNQTKGLIDETLGTVDKEAYLTGVKDFVEGKALRVSAEESQVAFAALREAMEAKRATANAATEEVAETFRTDFAAQEGVVTLPSGLMYQVITEGDGPKPGPEDTVTTHYHGTLTDGTVFDSSVERGQPASFPVNGVIAGWTEALQLMGVGSKWRLVVPSDLAYGERGAGGQIGPGATLMFEVELLSID